MLFTRKIIYFSIQPVILLNCPIPFNFSMKFLGITIDFKLNWKSHIYKIQKKLSSACGVLYILRNKITLNIARTLYFSLVYPYLTYGNIIWASTFSTNMKGLRVTQKKIVRIMLRKRRFEPSTPLFARLKLLKLDDINKLNAFSFLFKSINQIISSPIRFQARFVGPYHLRNPQPLQVPNHGSNQSKYFIHVRGSKLWNSLPNEIRSTANNFLTFKRKIKHLFMSEYTA